MSLRTEVSVASSCILALTGACAGDRGADDAGVVSRDSVGIRIVESTAPAWTEESRWTIDEEPFLQIGDGADGDPDRQFAYINGVHRLTDGMIVVVDAWIPGVIFFDSTGTLLGRAGRRGTGPGELPARAVPTSFACGTDTVYVRVQRQIFAYVAPGEYVRAFALESPAAVRACTGTRLVGLQVYGEWRTTPGVFTDSAVLTWYDASGVRRAEIDTLPFEERSWVEIGAEGVGYSRLPFGRTLGVAARSSRLATGYSDAFEIALRDTTGAVTHLLRAPILDEPVSPADIERFRDFVFDPWRGNDDERTQLEERIAEAEGRTRPAFAELRFDAEGNLWARRYDHLDAVEFYDFSAYSRSGALGAQPELDEPRRWVVFDATGRYLGEVETPRGLIVQEIGDDWVLGVWRDELDIPYVRLHRIVKPGG